VILDGYPELRDRRRLRELARIGVDREAGRPYLDEIVRSVADRLGTPFAVVTVLLNGAQIFLARVGPVPAWIGEAGGTPAEWSFCLPMLRTRAVWYVNDFATEPDHRDNPLVTVEGIRSYIAAPMITGTGHVVGGLCGLDVRPREFDTTQMRVLQDLADEAVRRIEARAGPANMES
jgi:GAF domain-containing protein